MERNNKLLILGGTSSFARSLIESSQKEKYLCDLKIESIFIKLDFQNSKSLKCDVLLNKFGFRKQVQQFDSKPYNYVYKRDSITSIS